MRVHLALLVVLPVPVTGQVRLASGLTIDRRGGAVCRLGSGDGSMAHQHRYDSVDRFRGRPTGCCTRPWGRLSGSHAMQQVTPLMRRLEALPARAFPPGGVPLRLGLLAAFDSAPALLVRPGAPCGAAFLRGACAAVPVAVTGRCDAGGGSGPRRGAAAVHHRPGEGGGWSTRRTRATVRRTNRIRHRARWAR